jgi:hypothetical protein
MKYVAVFMAGIAIGFALLAAIVVGSAADTKARPSVIQCAGIGGGLCDPGLNLVGGSIRLLSLTAHELSDGPGHYSRCCLSQSDDI